jgi:hypothetical protein
VTLAKLENDTEGPRTFIAGLAAVCLGAWLYAMARHDRDRPDDAEDP